MGRGGRSKVRVRSGHRRLRRAGRGPKQPLLGLLSAGSLHFQQSEPIAGKGRWDFHHAGPGGCPDKRHDAEVVHVLGNDIAAVHFAVRTELLDSLEVAGPGGLGAVFYLEGDEAAFDGCDDVHFLVFAAFPLCFKASI